MGACDAKPLSEMPATCATYGDCSVACQHGVGVRDGMPSGSGEGSRVCQHGKGLCDGLLCGVEVCKNNDVEDKIELEDHGPDYDPDVVLDEVNTVGCGVLCGVGEYSNA